MQGLLDKVKILNFEYKKLRDKNDFNVFALLRGSHDEVNLHSRFIYELLNPQGNHREESEFLKSFLETIEEIKDFYLQGVEVRKERHDIDILITNQQRRQAIILENKIRAADQDRQLERYYNKIKEEGYEDIWMVYLTLHGKEPSEGSLGDLPKEVIEKYLITISYSHDVCEWLEKCISKSARKPALREAIIQYSNLIKEITGKSMNDIEERKELCELLSRQDNIRNAWKIVSNWNHIRWHLEFDFWRDFEDIIAKEYKILPNQKYSQNDLENFGDVIHYVRKKNKHAPFGIMFEIFSIRDDKFCLFIRRSLRSDGPTIRYGITILDKNGNRNPETHDKYSKLANDILKEYPIHIDIPRKDGSWREFWLGLNYLEPKIGFESLSDIYSKSFDKSRLNLDEATLKLINKEYRANYLKENWEKIKEFIEQAKKIKDELNQ